MKRITTLIGLITALVFASAFTTPAQTLWSGTLAKDYTNIVAKAGQLTSLTLQSTGFPTTVTIWDSGTVSNHYASVAYTNATPTVFTATALYTNMGGTTNTYTYTAITNALATVASSSVSYPVLIQYTCPSNATVSLTFNNLYFNRGLLLTNTGGGTFAATYRSR